MIFQKKQDYISPTQSNNVLGGTCRFDISREYPIEAIFIVVSATVTTGAATLNADGLLKLLRRITLNGPDGARNRNVVDVSGPDLVELAYHYNGFLDRNTRQRLNAAVSGAATYEMIFPIWFALPQLDDPLSSALILPVDRFNANPQLNIQFASQAEMDTNAAPTFVLGTTTVTAVIVRRIVDRINWPVYDTELFSLQANYANTGDNQEFVIPNNGNYTGILLRCQGGTAAAPLRQDISPANSDWDLRISGNVLRRFRLLDIQRENDFSSAVGSAATDALNGSFYLDFLTDRVGNCGSDIVSALGSTLNANIPLNSGVKISLRQNITGNTGTQVNYVMHRIYGNLEKLKR